MPSRLDPILAQKKLEVAELIKRLEKNLHDPIHAVLNGKTKRHSTKSFKAALQNEKLAVIAEIKRKSPSKGNLAEIIDPVTLAKKYSAGGANAISVLTDRPFFNGGLEDLAAVAKALPTTPILRKDFIIDIAQIAEAVIAGADAVLLMVCVLKEKTKSFMEAARAMNIDALVEVHDAEELKMAIDSGAEIIGVNNRDFSNLEVYPERALELVGSIPKHCVKVAESGILQVETSHEYACAGFNAVLVGEMLVKAADPAALIEEMKQ